MDPFGPESITESGYPPGSPEDRAWMADRLEPCGLNDGGEKAVTCSDALGGEREQQIETGKFQTIGDFMLEPMADTNWRVDGLLPAGGTGLIAGAPKAGKSTLARNLVVSIARGGWLLGRECFAGPTIYALFEGRAQGARQHFVDMETNATDPVHVYHGEPPVAPWVWLESVIKDTGAVAVFLDTLPRLLRLEDLNSYAEVTKATQPMIGVANRTGCTVVGLTHRRKSGGERGEEAMGSTAFLGAVDTFIGFKEDGDRRSIYSRQREGEDMEETAIRLDRNGWNTLGSTARNMCRDELETDIAQHLADLPLDAGALARKLRKRKEVILAILNRMVERGTAIKTGTGQRGDPFRFQAP